MKRCLICESDRMKKAFDYEGYDYFRCASCGMLLVDLRLGADEVHACYSEDYYEADACEDSGRRGYPSYRESEANLSNSFKSKLSLVRKYVPAGQLLDAGAAYGVFLKVASQHFSCVGIDVSAYAASVARTEYDVDVRVGDLEHAAFPDEQFDVVVMWDIIEHLIHPVESLRQVSRILKPGGYAFISTDDASHWLPRALGLRWWALGPPMHLCHFSKKGMQVACERAGLKLESFQKDPRRYTISEVFKHFGVSYQSRVLTGIGTVLEWCLIGRLGFHINRPEQFVAVVHKPGSQT